MDKQPRTMEELLELVEALVASLDGTPLPWEDEESHGFSCSVERP